MMAMEVVSTREIIEKLQEYERENGVGAVLGIGKIRNGDGTIEYKIRVANDSDYNRVFKKDGKYKETEIEISSIEDTLLFENNQ